MNNAFQKKLRSTGCSSEYLSLFRQSEKSCTEFYYCEDDQWKLKNCPLGKFFNSLLQTCTTDSSFCEIQSTEINSCISNSTKLNEMNCGSYYICFEGIWQHSYCEEGTYFNQTHGKCVKVDGTCKSISKIQHQPCKNGTIVKMNLNSCSAHKICIDERWLIQYCPNGHYFNETFKTCMEDNDELCADDADEKYAVRKFKPTNCTVFEISLKNEWLTVDCPTGFYFDIILNKCLVNNGECSSNGLIRQICINQTLQPSFNNFSEFYQCLNNEWLLESCMENLKFDAFVKQCKVSNNYTNVHDSMNLSKCNNINQQSGFYYSDETDCTKFYFCEDGIRFEGVCNKGRFFDIKSQQCQNDKAVCDDPKQIAHDNICQKSSNGMIHRNPSNCSTFYTCINMTALLTNCPQGHYFDAELGACQSDISKCTEKRHCDGNNPSKFPHETYCSIYYTCIGGKLIAIACEELYFFDSVLNDCVPDTEQLCVDGLLKNSNSTDHATSVSSIITDSISCTGRQGDIMPDPKNCYKFYVCINEQLRHDKCFEGEFFDITKNSCIPKISNEQCQNNTDTTMKCSNSDREVNYADHTDCRKYFQCNDAEVISKKCRNGESFDNLLGFCRQNDGTCLIENGQRVGACAGKHGKLVEDADNCQQYFSCINGQKISKKCKVGEYFDKSASICEKDLNKTCTTFEDKVINKTQLSCDGLNQSVFYPNALDGCKSFFECVNSIPKIHKCPEDFLYDKEIGACNWKEKVKCLNEFNHEQKK